MRPAPLIASGGLLLLACSCYGPAYQQPYGYPGYPGQVQPGYPGGPSLGTPTFDSSQAPTGSGDGTFFNESSSGGGARPVPDPADPPGGDSPYFPSGGSAAPTGSATVPNVEPLSFDFPQPTAPVPQPSTSPSTQPAAQPSGANPFFDLGTDEDFERPVQGNPISFQREVSAVISHPYGQGQGHRWLQGVVNQDARDGSWGIIYDIEPDGSDPYAGYLTIAHGSPTQGLRDGQVVRLEGRVDPAAKDRFGRATYLVSNVAPAAMGSL